MRKLIFSATILLFALCSMLLSAQTTPEKKLIATLGPGETMANQEDCFLLAGSPESFSFVTVTGSGTSKQFYCYGKDGSKTGPVKQPDPAYWAGRPEVNDEDCIANKEPKQGDPQQYIDWTSGSVKFQGKTFGPYGQVMMFYLSDNEQNFYAIALSAEMKIIFFDNNNRKVELINIAEQVMISPDGTKAYAMVKGSINPFEPDAVQKMMDNPEEMNNPKINLYGIDGSKIGPFTSADFSDAWFIPSGQLVVYNGHEISLDGKVLFKSEDYISKCDLWISRNGKEYAWADYENLTFSDGTKYVAPLEIKYVESNGKGMLKWLSLENKKDLVFYKRAF